MEPRTGYQPACTDPYVVRVPRWHRVVMRLVCASLSVALADVAVLAVLDGPFPLGLMVALGVPFALWAVLAGARDRVLVAVDRDGVWLGAPDRRIPWDQVSGVRWVTRQCCGPDGEPVPEPHFEVTLVGGRAHARAMRWDVDAGQLRAAVRRHAPMMDVETAET